MLHFKQAIIVEGKYDKTKLSSIIDSVILTTNGFHIFKDKEMMQLIRWYAQNTGIIILTDSDSAGFKIRNYIKGSVKNGKIYHVYTPDIYGKEHRKEKFSAEGKLGVEGIPPKILLEAFAKAGITDSEERKPENCITKTDLYLLGLNGGQGSREKRQILQRKLGLPELLSTASLVEILNSMMTREELENLLERNKE